MDFPQNRSPLRESELLQKKYKIDPTSGCWNWVKAKSEAGYGVIVRAGKQMQAHRWVYGVYKTQIPDELHAHHKCENRACVNPDHILPVTPAEHAVFYTASSSSAINAAKTRCKKGHPLPEYELGKRRICAKCHGDKVYAYLKHRKAF